MKNRAFVAIPGLCFFLSLLCMVSAVAQPAAPVRLSIQRQSGQNIRIAWPDSAVGFVLESANPLSIPIVWSPVAQTPVLQDNQFSVTLQAAGSSLFFRLRLPGLTTIRTSSPANGEEGVAVIRETIVWFTGPLATNAVVTTTNFYAGYGGRRLLSRVELSSDRMKATLFYLEPLPGSTRVNVVFDGTGLNDFLGQPLDPDHNGRPGGSAVISFTTLSTTPLAATAVIGTVYASDLVPGAGTGTNAVNRPLERVTITVDGMEQTLRTTTDALGNFKLEPVPPGQFFVKIDGRTAVGSQWPAGAYYPYVGKMWEAIAGKEDNLAGGTGKIYLPLITQGTLQPVSLTNDTMITFPAAVVSSNPALAGVSIIVPANSLFGDDGTRGGKVGLAPVPPDRLPGPLPPGAQPALVITVQTDGPLNFDRPAPVCFPNLPDPNTGQLLAPGTKQALISFNHKKGDWEAVGSMTVSADGKLICTDPGIGILQPGWHFPAPPPPPPPDPPPPPPDPCPADGGYYPDPECVGGDSSASLSSVTATANQLQECNQRSSDDYKRCGVYSAAALARAIASCGISGANAADCLAGIVAASRIAAAACQFNSALGPKQCGRYFGASTQPASSLGLPGPEVRTQNLVNENLPSSGNPVADQIISIYAQIRDLVYPFFVVNQPLPQNAQNQVNALLAQATALAGGDAAQYLNDFLLQLENAAAPLEAQIGEGYGYVAPYSILFFAEIKRPDSILRLRGKTQPFGQYLIFVPSDGVLQYISFYDPKTKNYGIVYPRVRPNSRYRQPRLTLMPTDASFPDSDNDGLPDVVEMVYGTDTANPDTDGDGIKDGAAVDLGLDPLGGKQTRTGIIATASTPGTAVDIAVENGLAVVAQLDKGVGIFDISNPLNPTLIGQIATPGNARAVAISGNWVAVATDTAGLVILDISSPTAPKLVHQIDLGSAALAVTAAGSTAYVGLANGQVTQVDLLSGTVLDSVAIGAIAYDVRIGGETLFAVSDTELSTYSIAGGFLDFLGKITTTAQQADPLTGRKRIFVGNGYALVSCWIGYDRIDVSDPTAMKLIGAAASIGPASFKQIVDNGSGLGVAAVGTNPRVNDPTHDIYLFDLSKPGVTTNYLTTLPTPGIAYAAEIYNGQAYIADGSSGLEVMNYLPYDAKGIPPAITLSATFPLNPAQVDENKSVAVSAITTDDVQVRNVEFYIDDVKVSTDGNYPFQYNFVTPAITASRNSFRVRAKATDTGGNSTMSAEVVVALTRDTTPPRVVHVAPISGRVLAVGSATNLSVRFNEAMNPATLTAATIQLIHAGTDGQMGTADDTPILGGVVAYQAQSRTASLSFGKALDPGLYQGVVTTGVTDQAGNPLAAPYSWSFRVFLADASGGQTITGNGTFDGSGGQDAYTFTASAGQVVYFDAQTGDNCATRITWRCTDATGAVLFDQRLAATGPCGPRDPGTIILTNGGNYTITISAPFGAVESYKFQVFDVVPQSFNIGFGQVVTNGVPAAGAGNLETPGALDVYTFTAAAGQVVYFDAQSRDNCSFPLLLWRCVDAKGAVVFDQRFAASGPCGPRDPGPLVLTNGGVYTITVYGSEDSTGTYQFALFDVVPQSFNIGIGQVVTNGVPAVGAGNLETPGTLDIYTFNATAGQVVYFDAQSRDNCSFPLLLWRCVDAKGAVVFDQRFAASGPCGPHDPGPLVLTNGGVYTITVYGSEDSTGTYQFALFDVVPQSFNIGIGQVVTNGVPAVGAGNLETPGTQDVYTFNATAGQVVYFDAQSRDNCSFPLLLWRCVDAKGAVVFDQRFAASGPCGPHDPGPLVLTNGGAYTITVYGSEDSTGTYQFELFDVVPQSFNIGIGQVVTNGVPAVGAGNLETPGTQDVYTFNATAGQVVYFDAQSRDNCSFPLLLWRCVDTKGAVVFDQRFAASGPCGPHDPGPLVLTNGGVYTITVYGSEDSTGTYQFELFDVVPQSFNIGIGQVVTNGVPAVGAGNLETPGTQDVYTFNATAGQVVYFDAQSRDNCSFPLLLWRCVDTKGAVVFDQRFAASGPCGPHDPGPLVLTNGGVYTITVYGLEDSTGTYQFELFDVVPQSFNIGLGQAVTNGVPAAGAGNLETPGALDIYTFNATAGQVVYFDARSRDNCSFPLLMWRCVDAKGAVVFDQRFAASGPCGPHDPGSLVLTNGGAYTITVYGSEDSTGTYQFELFDVVPQSFNIGIGQVVTNGVPAVGAGNIETPGTQDVYTFNATAGQAVHFDAQSGDNCVLPLKWRCVDATGGVLFDQLFGAAGPCGPGDPGTITTTNGGTYTITVYGVEDGTGTYQFQIRNPP